MELWVVPCLQEPRLTSPFPARMENFFCCYLLTPEEPPHRLRATYVGCSVSPVRQILQHDCFRSGGAAATEEHARGKWFASVFVIGEAYSFV